MKTLKNTKLKIIVICLIVILLTIILIGSVWAYFTANIEGKGEIILKTGEAKIQIQQTNNENIKNINVTNTGNMPCSVRTRIFCVSENSVSIKDNTYWNRGEDGYWYYSKMLKAGETTETLIVEKNNNTNVFAICEATEYIYYDENDKLNANWDYKYSET